RPARLRARLQRAQVRPEVLEVPVGGLRERGVRERGEIVRAVGPLAEAHRADEIGLGPAAESRVRVGRDVRPVERPERRLERPPAGEGLGVLLVLGVAADAAARLGDVFAALGIALRERACGAQRENERETVSVQHVPWPGKESPAEAGPVANFAPYCFSRKFSWQPPHALPVAPSCAFTAASSPLALTWTSFETSFCSRSCACLNLSGSLQIAGSAAVLAEVPLVSGLKPSHGILSRTLSLAALRFT